MKYFDYTLVRRTHERAVSLFNNVDGVAFGFRRTPEHIVSDVPATDIEPVIRWLSAYGS